MITPDVDTVARWMADKVLEEGYLDQGNAAWTIEHEFGEEFVYENESGGTSINRNALQAFRALSEHTVVWDQDDKSWRMRADYDSSGRRQDWPVGSRGGLVGIPAEMRRSRQPARRFPPTGPRVIRVAGKVYVC